VSSEAEAATAGAPPTKREETDDEESADLRFSHISSRVTVCAEAAAKLCIYQDAGGAR
jgi:hypothetical protein